MKKTFALLGATALATTLAAGSAFAAEPIKLTIGGFGAMWVGYASQDDAFLRATGKEVTAVDVKGDNELHLKGKTTLDNGLTVSVAYELENGGRNSSSDVSDRWNIDVSGSFGTIRTGARNNAAVTQHHYAPRVGGRLWTGGVGNDVMAGNFVLKPAGFDDNFLADSSIDDNGNSEALTYLSPAIAGFSFGASYIPDASQADDTPAQPNGANTQDMYVLSLAYDGKLGAVTLGADVQWGTSDRANTDNHNEYVAGLNIGYSGFTFGGGYRLVKLDMPGSAPNTDAKLWEVGVSYETGPYGVSVQYISGDQEVARTEDDEVRYVELVGEYKMGPGVSLVGGVAHVSFDQAGTASTGADNDGWVVSTGLSLTF